MFSVKLIFYNTDKTPGFDADLTPNYPVFTTAHMNMNVIKKDDKKRHSLIMKY